MDRLTGQGVPDGLPVGRRVAYWRGVRRMSQQVFADRLGKSKSWVDKIERGVRRLDKMSVVRQIADVLGISVSQLTGTPDTAGHAHSRLVPEVEAVRAALTRHELQLGGCPPGAVPELGVVERSVGHAWLCLARADYGRLLRALPDLITTAHWCRTAGRGEGPGGGEYRLAGLVGQVYQVTAEVLRRLGVLDVAWLAADRAILASAGLGDETSTSELLDQAETVAEAVGPGHDYHYTCFGPALVAITRVATAVELGHGPRILADLPHLASDPDFHRLPAAIRAAYQIDLARAHLQDGDPTTAGRALLAADRTAAGEVRTRPAARDVLAAVLRASPNPEPAVTQLAETLNLTI